MSETESIVGDPLRDEVSVKQDLTTTVDDVVNRRLRSTATWMATLLVGVVFGGIITSLWELNGKIHTFIGQETVRAEISEIHKHKIELLEAEKDFLEKRNEALRSEIASLQGATK